MNQKIKKDTHLRREVNMNLVMLKKKLKIETIVIFLLAFVFISTSALGLLRVIEYSNMKKTDFVVKKESTELGYHSKEYVLYIDGENLGVVDYNRYMRLDEAGKTNVKANVMMDEVKASIRKLIMGATFCCLMAILYLVQKGETPFNKKNINYLRVLSILIVLLPFSSFVIDVIGSMYYFSYLSGELGSMNVYLVCLGLVFGILAEIFQYGTRLQEDMDQIA